VQNDQRLLVACDSHTAEEIESVRKRALSIKGNGADDEKEDR
jgi:hypothetical protein